ncbi:uncharacterized protein N7503_000392 [Penicillium pulvis]|uniref:uncharacterized protein n=1 Tax=Penicillium pulvis TaxID=1562058 RepID=UPI00254934D4|nr:uncharacterized protein N7503_000392 [Penicillium pulvis]KAJ5813642.1 hypothetical protein N7503_000392 [Penicillium pulvis]
MKRPNSTRFLQIHAAVNGHDYEPVASYKPDKIVDTQDHASLHSRLQQLCSAEFWPRNSHTSCCPRPILISPEHQKQVKNLHEGLVLAITDIVERWWTDDVARFPERMPLSESEEDLLRWMDAQPDAILPPYRGRLGSWRPDFLIEQDSAGDENFRISEINSRFSFNGLMHEAYAQQALQDIGVSNGRNGLMGTSDVSKMVGGLLRLFQPSQPLHLLKGKEKGMDIHMFVDFARRHLGLTPRFITPEDLRLVPDPHSTGHFKLCCLAQSDASPLSPNLVNSEGEVLEEIQQVGLELHQHELLSLQPEMLRQLSLRCFNDLRTVLLVHDKRMLGIVREEVQPLVARGVLTPLQATCLDRGIAETLLPGSPDLEALLQRCRVSPTLKADYILKPIRSGKGDGIIFGDDLSPAQWISCVEGLSFAALLPGSTKFVVQRKITPVLYDVFLRESGTKMQYPLVGTYHSIDGEYLGFGVWRSSADRVVAISHGGAWMCSVMHRD